MGLDMYLNARRNFWHDPIKDQVQAVFQDLPSSVKITEVSAEVGRWRKANAIHAWFVANVQSGVDECQTSEVSRADIEDLRGACQQVLDNPQLAVTVLPTQQGFFFGSTDYGQHYFQDLKASVDICNQALALPDEWTLEYRSSW